MSEINPRPGGFAGLSLARLRTMLVSDSVLLFGIRIANIAAMLCVNVIIARTLTKQQAGEYFALWGTVYYLAFVGHLGLRTTVVQWVAQAAERKQVAQIGSALRTAFLLNHLSYGTVGVAFLVICGVRQLASPESEFVVLAFPSAMWLIFLGMQYSLSETFRGFERHCEAGILGGLLTNLLLILLLAVIWSLGQQPSLLHVVWATALASGVNYLLIGQRLLRLMQTYPATALIPVRTALSQSIPMLLTTMASASLTLMDVAILGWFVPEETVAVYGAACRLAALASITNQVSLSILTPKLARAIAINDFGKVHTLMRNSFRPMFLATAGIMLVFVVFGSLILQVAFGSGFEAGWIILNLIACVHGLAALAGRTAVVLMLSGQQTTAMRVNLLGTAAAFLCQTLGAYFAGAVGVACGTLVAYSILVTLQNLATKSILRSSDA